MIETTIYKCEYCGAEFNIEDKTNPNYYGLWWFGPALHYGEWVRVDDQIKRWTDMKNKFIKDT